MMQPIVKRDAQGRREATPARTGPPVIEYYADDALLSGALEVLIKQRAQFAVFREKDKWMVAFKLPKLESIEEQPMPEPEPEDDLPRTA
jgi:hypothetical protein